MVSGIHTIPLRTEHSGIGHIDVPTVLMPDLNVPYHSLHGVRMGAHVKKMGTGALFVRKRRAFLSLLFLSMIFSLLSLAESVESRAQGSVRVELFRPPPNQLKAADLWRVRLTNTTTTTMQVTLFGTVTEFTDGLLIDARTAVLSLAPGTHLVVGSELQPIDANYYDDRYKDAFIRTGSVPDGTYRVCVSVRDAQTDAELGTDCYDQPILNARPPILVLPEDEAVVEDPVVAFTWLPPAPLAPGTRLTYRLKIVEILGRQTPYDAMQSNPAWFERDRISSPVFLWPLGARKFVPDHEYAWMVSAERDGFPMGESEIWGFKWNVQPTQGSGITTRSATVDSSDINIVDGSVVIVREGLISGPFKVKRAGTTLSAGSIRPDLMIDPSKQVEVSDKFIPASILEELLRSCSE